MIEVDLAEVTEPILACPNRVCQQQDDVKILSEVAGAKIDEVFIGSCMTNIGHFRAAGKVREGKSDIPTRLWIAPLTKMDALAGRIITVEEYMEQIKLVNAKSAEVYRYMNFDQIPAFVDQVATVEI